MKKGLIALVSILLLLLGWQITAVWMNQPELIPSLPKLTKTLAELFTTGTFYLSVAATIGRGLLGMFLSLTLSFIVACLFTRYELLYELFRPLLTIMRSVPVISFILLALLFLNPESIPLMIGFLTMFPLLTENLAKGIRNLRPDLSVLSHQFRIGKWNKLIHILYPQLKPFLFSGLASAAGFGWRAIIMGEVLSQCSLGIGSEMKRAQNFIAVPELMAWTVIAILISFFFDKGISRMATWNGKIHFTPTPKPIIPDTARKDPSPVQLSDIKYGYGITSFSYTFNKGRIYGISAPSGTGKTTLLNLINGTLTPTKGHIEIDRHPGIASVFQEPELLVHLTALENVVLPLARLFPKEKAFQEAKDMLEEMEVGDLSERYPEQLSYGQQQRIAIARALAYPAPLLLMDEPFKGLDEALAFHIIKQIQRRQKGNDRTILFTSHNLKELERLADEVIVLTAMN